jgi:hypothetical protein
MITVRLERPKDIPVVRTINRAAFEQPAEASVIIVFEESAVQGVSGVARYRAEFDAAS